MNKKEEVLRVFQRKSKELYQGITLLPKFDNSKAWYEQSDFYNKGFEHFAKELIQKLDESKNEAFDDYQEALDVFKGLLDFTKKQKLEDVAKQANEFAKQSKFERLYKPKIDEMIKESIEEVENVYKNNQNDNILSLPNQDPKSIIEKFEKRLKEEIPPIVQNDKSFAENQEKGKTLISKKISHCQDLICSSIKSNIIKKSETELDTILSVYKEKISKYKGNNFNEIFQTKENIKKELFESIDKMVQNSGLSKDFLIDINNKLDVSINENISKFQIEGYKEFYHTIIDNYIKELKIKCKNDKKEIQESDCNYILIKVKENTPFEIQNHPKFKEIEDEIESQIQTEIKESTDFNSNIRTNQIEEIKNTITKELKNLCEEEISRMNETKDIEIDQILPKDNIKGIKKNISNEINKIICEKNYSEQVKTQTQKEINDIIESEIEKLRIKAMSLSNDRKRDEEMQKQKDEFDRLKNELDQIKDASKKNEDKYNEEIKIMKQQQQEELEKIKNEKGKEDINQRYEELFTKMQNQHDQEMNKLLDQIKEIQKQSNQDNQNKKYDFFGGIINNVINAAVEFVKMKFKSKDEKDKK